MPELNYLQSQGSYGENISPHRVHLRIRSRFLPSLKLLRLKSNQKYSTSRVYKIIWAWKLLNEGYFYDHNRRESMEIFPKSVIGTIAISNILIRNLPTYLYRKWMTPQCTLTKMNGNTRARVRGFDRKSAVLVRLLPVKSLKYKQSRADVYC
ncbi:hypothetical protein AVEN_20417-1 [Araneus ventricosus]|uniref:Uncharacterized protein n=1 Tax=Araneus ventricosus TaxID=182803 RepID=A0A4Y2W5R5_ARAVE|nr:hypothetical protein AVEN_20417-1 [Araneus ventricosus]